MRIKKEDKVLVIAGKYKGKKGKVIKVLPTEGKVVVEGVNLVKRHVRPKKSGEKGQIVEMPSPFDISNVKLICSNCNKPTRVGYKVEGKNKVRICKKCGKEV
jgi:large subunit ribosomal protein L24